VRENFYKWLSAVSIVGLVVVAFITQDVAREQSRINQTLAEQANLREQQNYEAQVQSCKLVGEPIRKAIVFKSETDAERLRGDVAESRQQEKQGIFKDLLPNLTEQELHALLEQSRQKDLDQAETLEGIAAHLSDLPPCGERIPEPLKLDPDA
jgi:flagellar biosynthesis/type III secretory pathway M-ring protein FliF/YscJ